MSIGYYGHVMTGQPIDQHVDLRDIGPGSLALFIIDGHTETPIILPVISLDAKGVLYVSCQCSFHRAEEDECLDRDGKPIVVPAGKAAAQMSYHRGAEVAHTGFFTEELAA